MTVVVKDVWKSNVHFVLKDAVIEEGLNKKRSCLTKNDLGQVKRICLLLSSAKSNQYMRASQLCRFYCLVRIQYLH